MHVADPLTDRNMYICAVWVFPCEYADIDRDIPRKLFWFENMSVS